MRRPLLVFLCAVLLPGLILGGLALRSIQHQEALLERERSRLLEGASERLAASVARRVDELQREFSLRVESLFGKEKPNDLAPRFDALIREGWPMAALGFAVSLKGEVRSPLVLESPEARLFLLRNEAFLCKEGSVEVYAVTPKGRINLASLEAPRPSIKSQPAPAKILPGRIHFADLIGDAQEGVLSRFLENQLVLWVWYRTPREPDLVFGAQLDLARLREDLSELVRATIPRTPGVAFALLDDRGRTIAVSPINADADWNRTLSKSPIGQTLPHWHIATAVHDPATVSRDGRRLTLTLTAVVGLLVTALGVGGWIVANDARRQLELARRKSDFVSNISHELRTPLTSIRLFAEMLSEDRVTDPVKRRQHLGVIQAEASRLHRLIGNVLDFARRDRGEFRSPRETVDLCAVTRQVLESFDPQFSAEGLRVDAEIPPEPVLVSGDADALAQVVNNLLSNAVKYGVSGGEVSLRLLTGPGMAELQVLDRGPGIPDGYSERVFEEFFRADDALASGVAGAGLGLTLARRIAQDHGGDVTFKPREGGGSVFRFTLPLSPGVAQKSP
jgi:signal transduction histidine kinase